MQEYLLALSELQEDHFDINMACDRIANKILQKREEIYAAEITEQVMLHFKKNSKVADMDSDRVVPG